VKNSGTSNGNKKGIEEKQLAQKGQKQLARDSRKGKSEAH